MTDTYLIKLDENIFQVYAFPILSLIGIILSIFIFLIFSHSSFKQNIYVFLKYESVFIWLDLCATAFPIFIYRPELDKSYFKCFYTIYSIAVLKSVLEMTGILCHIMSSIELVLLISNKARPKPFQKVPNLIIVLILYLISALIYSYKFFAVFIDAEPYGPLFNNATNKSSFQYVGYKISSTKFDKSFTKKLIEIIAFVIRDGISLIVLIALNFLIYFKFKKTIAKKKRILKLNISFFTTNNKNEANINNKLKRSKRKTAFMVMIVSICYTIGRMPIMISFIIRNLYDETNGMRIFRIASVISVILSYDSYFFIYYFTNNNFKKLFRQYLTLANKKYRK
jgi:hypothetical protein